jgi:hypothetical protein
MIRFLLPRKERRSDYKVTRIDIDRLSEKELIDLNHKIVARLRFLREMRSHAEMINFRIGEKVRFHPAGHPEVTGTLTRYNKKSVTVIAEDGMRWNVHPSFLSRVGPDTSERGRESSQDGSVILFPNQGAKPGS